MAHNSGDDRHSVTIVDIDDPAAANAGSELFDFRAVQLQSRPFKIRRIIVRLDTATVVFHSTNVPVRTAFRVLTAAPHACYRPGADAPLTC